MTPQHMSILDLSTRLARCWTRNYGCGFRDWRDVIGQSFEAVVAANKTWREGGQSFGAWAYQYLKVIMAREGYSHKVHKGHKARYVSLDESWDGEEGEGMSNHELVGDDGAGVREIEETLEVREILRDVSPRLREVVEMLAQGHTLYEIGQKYGGLTPARVHQLRAKVAAGMRAEAVEGEEVRLF